MIKLRNIYKNRKYIIKYKGTNKMTKDFLPVILGTDTNVYGVASSFHQAYKINSVALGMIHQIYTDNLDFLKVYTFKNFDHSDIFVKELNEFAKKDEVKDKKLLLISCSDYYSALIIKNKNKLDQKYLINMIEEDLRVKLENKMDFYETCEKYKLPYPKTFIISKDNYKNFSLPFEYPVIAKPNDSIKYVKIKFEGYKKAYKADSAEELKDILKKVYNSGYDDYFIIQDFIPGGVDTMYVVNAYVDRKGKVRMTCGARCALDECLPNDIGNYNALITGDYGNLTSSVKEFLEKIDYRGFANFDFKYDCRDNKFKVFEINLRQGRSSYYMTVSGNNFIKYIVEDLVEDKEYSYYDHKDEHIWYHTAKSVLKHYCPKNMKEQVNRLFKENKATYSLSYYENKNIKRRMLAARRKLSTIKYYPKFEKGRN